MVIRLAQILISTSQQAGMFLPWAVTEFTAKCDIIPKHKEKIWPTKKTRHTRAQYYITRAKIHFCSCSHFLQSQMLTLMKI